jgi:SAM-dependent methyltransferase
VPVPSANPWALPGDDPVRELLERDWLEQLLRRLSALAPGPRVLDLGCGDGLVADLIGNSPDSYLGLDLFPPSRVNARRLDLREGLGPLRGEPFDLYVASFGFASHLSPDELCRLMRDIAASASPGALVALEALGLYSLEWPGIWEASPGGGRTLGYRLAAEVPIHPWAPLELATLAEAAGLRPFVMLDRSVQFGPKLGDGGHWPGLPPLRSGLARLLRGDSGGVEALAAALPPLPAHPAAQLHHALTTRRGRLVQGFTSGTDPGAVARSAWGLEPRTGCGVGHGLMLLARAG